MENALKIIYKEVRKLPTVPVYICRISKTSFDIINSETDQKIEIRDYRFYERLNQIKGFYYGMGILVMPNGFIIKAKSNNSVTHAKEKDTAHFKIKNRHITIHKGRIYVQNQISQKDLVALSSAKGK